MCNEVKYGRYAVFLSEADALYNDGTVKDF